MVSTAVELAVLVEVDQVDEQLLADRAGKAGGVPDSLGARARRCHADVSAKDRVSALQDKLLEVKKWCDGRRRFVISVNLQIRKMPAWRE